VQRTGIFTFKILRCAAPYDVAWLCGFYKYYLCAAPGFINFHYFSILLEPAAAPRNVCSNCYLPGFLKVQRTGTFFQSSGFHFSTNLCSPPVAKKVSSLQKIETLLRNFRFIF